MSNPKLKHQTKIGIYWSFINNFSNLGLSFVVGVVLARLLSPSDYGITALPAVFLSVATIFQNGGLSTALIRKPEVSDADLSTAFFYGIGMGIFLYALLFFTAPFIADFYETPILTSLIRITSLVFLWGPLVTTQNVILNRRLDFKTPTKVTIVTRLLSAAVGISMAYAGFGVWALVLSGVIASLADTIFKWYIVRWFPTTGWSKSSFHYLWNFGNKMMISGLLDTLYNNITPLFVAKHYSTADLGVYNRANQYAALPSSNITGVIQNVTFPVLSKLQDDTAALAINYRKMLRVTAFVIFPIMLMLSALAKPFIIVLVTDKWADSILLLQIICFSMMWYPIHAMNLNLLQVKGRSDLFLRLEVIKKIIGLSIMVVTLPLGLVVFCCGSIVGGMIGLVINTYYTGKLINVGYWKQMHDLFPIFLLALVSFFTVHGVNLFIENNWLQLFIGGGSGALVYLLGAIIFKFPELDEVKYMLNRKK